MVRPKKVGRKRKGRETLREEHLRLTEGRLLPVPRREKLPPRRRSVLCEEAPPVDTSPTTSNDLDSEEPPAGNAKKPRGKESSEMETEASEFNANQVEMEIESSEMTTGQDEWDIESPKPKTPTPSACPSPCATGSGSATVGDVLDGELEQAPEFRELWEKSLDDDSGNEIDLPEDSCEVIPIIAEEVIIVE